MKNILLSLVASLAFAGAANAALFDGDVSFDTGLNRANPGLQIRANPLSNKGSQVFTSAETDFELAVGETTSISLFVVRTLQKVVAVDDFVEKAFSLVFDFGPNLTATVNGNSYAETGDIDGDGVLDVYGVLDFEGPVTIALGNAQELVITLTDVVFNLGVNPSFTPGKKNGAVVSATFALAAVPLPATLPLGLGALGLLGLIARRRKAVSQA